MLDDWHRKRYLVLPGITGLWQVSGRSELDFDELVHLDFLYLESWSLALDLTILLRRFLPCSHGGAPTEPRGRALRRALLRGAGRARIHIPGAAGSVLPAP